MSNERREDLVQEGSMRERAHEANPVSGDLSREIEAFANKVSDTGKVYEAGVGEDGVFRPAY